MTSSPFHQNASGVSPFPWSILRRAVLNTRHFADKTIRVKMISTHIICGDGAYVKVFLVGLNLKKQRMDGRGAAGAGGPS
jgi:hypothetical protein